MGEVRDGRIRGGLARLVVRARARLSTGRRAAPRPTAAAARPLLSIHAPESGGESEALAPAGAAVHADLVLSMTRACSATALIRTHEANGTVVGGVSTAVNEVSGSVTGPERSRERTSRVGHRRAPRFRSARLPFLACYTYQTTYCLATDSYSLALPSLAGGQPPLPPSPRDVYRGALCLLAVTSPWTARLSPRSSAQESS